MTERCPSCLLPLATEEDWKRYHQGEGDHLCWWGSDCRAPVAPLVVQRWDVVVEGPTGEDCTSLERWVWSSAMGLWTGPSPGTCKAATLASTCLAPLPGRETR